MCTFLSFSIQIFGNEYRDARRRSRRSRPRRTRALILLIENPRGKGGREAEWPCLLSQLPPPSIDRSRGLARTSIISRRNPSRNFTKRYNGRNHPSPLPPVASLSASVDVFFSFFFLVTLRCFPLHFPFFSLLPHCPSVLSPHLSAACNRDAIARRGIDRSRVHAASVSRSRAADGFRFNGK